MSRNRYRQAFFSICIFVFVLLGCNNINHKINATVAKKEKENFCLSGDFYKDEVIELRYFDSLIFQEKVLGDSINWVNKYFKFNYPDSFQASLRTYYSGKIYLDTVFFINNVGKVVNYKITITHPHPFDWQKYYKEGVPVKSWGFLPIDSSIRFINLAEY